MGDENKNRQDGQATPPADPPGTPDNQQVLEQHSQQAAEIATKAVREATVAENKRIASIREVCNGKHDEIEGKAIAEGWDENQTSKAVLAAIRESREKAPAAHVVGGESPAAQVYEAAMANTLGWLRIEDHYDAKVCEAADKLGPMALCRGIEEMAKSSGVETSLRETRNPQPEHYIEAAHSVAAISGALSGILNKSLIQGFTEERQTWAHIATIGNATDYKAMKDYRIESDVLYKEVPINDNVPTVELSESEWDYQVKRYALMLTVDEIILINDDIGAIADAARQLGSGGGRTLDRLVWSTFEGMGFNEQTGGGTDLSQAGFDALHAAFAAKVIPSPNAEAEPLNRVPSIVVVHSTTVPAARRIMVSEETTNADGTTNPHRGQYKIVDTPRLSNATPWFGMANVASAPVIKVAFLNGQRQPSIKRDTGEISNFKLSWRYSYNFAVGPADTLAVEKMAGTAAS